MIRDVYHLHKPSMASERLFDFTRHVRGHEGDPCIVEESLEVDADKYHKGDGKYKVVKAQPTQYIGNVDDWEGIALKRTLKEV